MSELNHALLLNSYVDMLALRDALRARLNAPWSSSSTVKAKALRDMLGRVDGLIASADAREQRQRARGTAGLSIAERMSKLELAVDRLAVLHLEDHCTLEQKLETLESQVQALIDRTGGAL